MSQPNHCSQCGTRTYTLTAFANNGIKQLLCSQCSYRQNHTEHPAGGASTYGFDPTIDAPWDDE